MNHCLKQMHALKVTNKFCISVTFAVSSVGQDHKEKSRKVRKVMGSVPLGGFSSLSHAPDKSMIKYDRL